MASDYFLEPWGANEWGLGEWGGDVDIRWFVELQQPAFIFASLEDYPDTSNQIPWWVGLNTWGKLVPPVPGDTWSANSESQTPAWVSISETQSPGWTPVNEGQ